MYSTKGLFINIQCHTYNSIKVQFDVAERPVGGINCGSGAALDDSNGDLETSKISGAPGMSTMYY